MQESKLLKYYATLKKEELKEWEAFVQSPFFNTNPNIERLCHLLKKYHPDFHHKALTKERVFKKLFKAPYNDLKMRKLMSATLKLLEKFWVHTKIAQETNFIDLKLADCFYERELYDAFEKKYRMLVADLTDKPYKTGEELQQLVHLHHHLFFNHNPLKKIADYTDLEKATAYLWEYNEQQSYYYASEWNNIHHVLGRPIPEMIGMVNQVLLLENKEQASNLSYVYRLVNLLLNQPIQETTAIYFQLKAFLYEQQLDEINQRWLFQHLINYVIRQNRGVTKIADEELQLYQFGLEQGTFLYRGKMTGMNFISIVMVFCKFNRFDLAELLIKDYSQFLPKYGVVNYEAFVKGYIYFAKEAYLDCFHLLSSFYFKDNIVLELLRRGLLIRSAYECSLLNSTYLEVAYSLVKNFDKFLTSHYDVNAHKQKLNQIFNNFLTTIIQWQKSIDSTVQVLESLIVEVEQETYLTASSKKWLLKHLRLLQEKAEAN